MNIAEKIYLNSPRRIQEMLLAQFSRNRRRKYRKNKHFPVAEKLVNDLEYGVRDINEFQRHQLALILGYAVKQVPFYIELFRNRELKLEPGLEFDALHKFPIVTKKDIQLNWESFQSKENLKDVFRTNTSGTSGTSLKLRITNETTAIERAGIYSYRKRAGYRDRDKIASFIGRKIMRSNIKHPPFWRYNKTDNQLIFSYWHLSDRTLPSYIDAYNDFEPDFVHGYPSFIHLVADFALKHNIRLHRPKAIYTSSETLLARQRVAIEEAFESSILDRYGTAEMVIAASQCEFGSYHENSELGYLEIVDGGKAVATSLHNFAMPLIRYELGDQLEWATSECPCGRRTRTIAPPLGRMEDIITAADGRKFGRLDHIFKDVSGVLEAQLIQEDLENLTVRIVPNGLKSISNSDIVNLVKSKLGDSFKINVVFLPHIPRTTGGKFKFVVSRLSNNSLSTGYD